MPPKKISEKAQPRARPAPKKIKEVMLQPEHSFDLVHTAIAATMFEVIFARKVLRSGVKWNLRVYDPTNPQTTYDSFISGAQQPENGHGRNWHVPVRDQLVVLDKLMDHFETGIKDALEKQYLSNISMSFHVAGTHLLSPATCLESYELEISYGPDGMPYISTAIRDNQGSQSTDMTLGEGKARLQTMVNSISDLFRLPGVVKAHKTNPLPGKCMWHSSIVQMLTFNCVTENVRVDLKLQYTSQTPPDYQPQNFQRYSESAWENDKKTGTPEEPKYKFETGFHGLAFSCTLPRNRDSALANPQPKSNVAETRAPAIAGAHKNVTSRRSARPHIPRRTLSQFSSGGGHTQPEVMRQLGAIRISRLDYGTPQDTQQYPAAPSRFAPSPPSCNTPDAVELTIPQYTQEVRVYAESKVRDLVLRGDEDRNAPHNVQISCECGASKHNGLLIKCLECGDFHHAECYGHLSDVPRAEFCYRCLRDCFPAENIILEDMRFLCWSRRTIRFFQTQLGPKTLEEVAKHLEMSTHSQRNKELVARLLGGLASDGYIVDRSVDKLRNLTGPSTFILAPGKDATIRYMLYNPHTRINHLFAENETPFAEEATFPFRGIEGSEVSGLGAASGYPQTPRAPYSNGHLVIRGMQDSSRRAFSVDDTTTQSGVSTPARLTGRGSRERSINSEFQTMGLSGSGPEKGSTPPGTSTPDLPRQRSGMKRSAESSRLLRSNRRKMM
ncbi:hypothetical protein ACEPPN_002687 [Leptodophora sp. 'Broadleaf-Isolate-01']